MTDSVGAATLRGASSALLDLPEALQRAHVGTREHARRSTPVTGAV
ncbi:hypothetical protein ACGFK1_31645 [Mycobacterium sp. NPDC048908]